MLNIGGSKFWLSAGMLFYQNSFRWSQSITVDLHPAPACLPPLFGKAKKWLETSKKTANNRNEFNQKWSEAFPFSRRRWTKTNNQAPPTISAKKQWTYHFLLQNGTEKHVFLKHTSEFKISAAYTVAKSSWSITNHTKLWRKATWLPLTKSFGPFWAPFVLSSQVLSKKQKTFFSKWFRSFVCSSKFWSKFDRWSRNIFLFLVEQMGTKNEPRPHEKLW